MGRYYLSLGRQLLISTVLFTVGELFQGIFLGEIATWLETEKWYKTVVGWTVQNPWVFLAAGAFLVVAQLFRRGRLARRGILRIRWKGKRLLDERIRPQRLRYAWHFRVIVINPSPDKWMGIQSIVLRSRKHPELSLDPTEGIVGAGIQGVRDEGLFGSIGSVLNLAPSQPLPGTLVFVGESSSFGENWNNGRLFDDGDIVLTDIQETEHSVHTDDAHVSPL